MATPVSPSLKTYPTFNDPAYLQRQSQNSGSISGNAATYKWVTFANIYLYTAAVLMDTLGTSTFSSTKSSQTVQFTVVVNTSTTGTSAALSTSTWGPYAVSGYNISTSTGTSFAGVTNYIAFNTNTGLAGQGGYYVPAGSEIIATLGADATAVVVVNYDYQIASLAPVTA